MIYQKKRLLNLAASLVYTFADIYFLLRNAAWAAANLAIGTLNGEQDI